MKTIGILGGMSWESTAIYYRIINQEINRRLGGLSSAKILINSVNFGDIEQWWKTDDWAGIGHYLAEHAMQLQKGGADALVIATNTMHKLAPLIEEHIDIPLLHIADSTGDAIKQSGLDKVGLLGTRFTMEEQFYTGYLASHKNIDVLIPDNGERLEINRIIFDELVHGVIKAKSRSIYKQAIHHLADRGAKGIILGCTEIPMLIQQSDVQLPLYDTTTLHALSAVNFALSESR